MAPDEVLCLGNLTAGVNTDECQYRYQASLHHRVHFLVQRYRHLTRARCQAAEQTTPKLWKRHEEVRHYNASLRLHVIQHLTHKTQHEKFINHHTSTQLLTQSELFSTCIFSQSYKAKKIPKVDQPYTSTGWESERLSACTPSGMEPTDLHMGKSQVSTCTASTINMLYNIINRKVIKDS